MHQARIEVFDIALAMPALGAKGPVLAMRGSLR